MYILKQKVLRGSNAQRALSLVANFFEVATFGELKTWD